MFTDLAIKYGIWLVGITLLFVLGVGVGYKWRDAAFQTYKAKEAIAITKEEHVIQKADEKHVEAEVKQQVVVKTVIQKVNNDIIKYIDRPVYHNICFDDDGLFDANRALTAGASPKGTAGEVSTTHATQ